MSVRPQSWFLQTFGKCRTAVRARPIEPPTYGIGSGLRLRGHKRVAATVVLAALPLLLPTFVKPAPAQSPPALREFRDCADCPVMVEIPGRMVIGKYPITRGEFRVFAQATDLVSEGCTLRGEQKRSLVAEANWLAPGFEQTDDHPVICVNWLEATAYADWLTERTGRLYRLPTFEESSAAAAAGTKTAFWWGEEFDNACAHANIADAQFRKAYPKDERKIPGCDDGYVHTSPVTTFPANEWGLHDMAGNVWNWTNSCLKGDCSNAIFRGAGWDVPFSKLFRSDYSFGDRIVLRNDVIGFRVLRED
jgi:sulfatase modifying factor 1